MQKQNVQWILGFSEGRLPLAKSEAELFDALAMSTKIEARMPLEVCHGAGVPLCACYQSIPGPGPSRVLMPGAATSFRPHD